MSVYFVRRERERQSKGVKASGAQSRYKGLWMNRVGACLGFEQRERDKERER